ncbi:MAG: ScyD/ScyE family protein [Chloroflexi bacterium]|nr:ScyD/ScyE family protein [Chloroflexota bacterium]
MLWLRLLLVSALVATTLLAPLEAAQAWAGPKISVLVTGLHNPRGLKFGPDRELFVAEAGLGGDQSSIGLCPQVPGPIGPYTGGFTSRVSSIDERGRRTTVVDHLPSAINAVHDVLGAMDVAFVGDRLYVLIAGAGCSHGLPGTSNGIVRVNRTGTTSLIADLSAFWHTHPASNPVPSADDFEPDGSPYSFVWLDGSFYVTEPNSSQVDRVSLSGRAERIIDMSNLHGNTWVGPTSITARGDNLYLGNLTPFFPLVQGAANVFRLTPRGELSTVASGLTAVLGVAFDRNGRLYALETSATGGPGPGLVPNTGRVVRVSRSGGLIPVVTGLDFPSAMTFGPDGNLYISNHGFGPQGTTGGQVLKVALDDDRGDD